MTVVMKNKSQSYHGVKIPFCKTLKLHECLKASMGNFARKETTVREGGGSGNLPAPIFSVSISYLNKFAGICSSKNLWTIFLRIFSKLLLLQKKKNKNGFCSQKPPIQSERDQRVRNRLEIFCRIECLKPFLSKACHLAVKP